MSPSRASKPIRRLAAVLAIVLATIVIHALIGIFPQPLFRHRVTHGNLEVYCTEEMPPVIHAVLDRVEALLAASELHEADLRHEVYLFNSYRLMRLLMVRNVHFGANALTGDTFITRGDAVRDRAWCKKLGPDDRRSRTLSGTIAHEITHRLIRRRVGWAAERRLPVWIKEGYCDYVARDSAIELDVGAAIMRGEALPEPGFPYFRARLLIAYLMNHEGLSFAEIVARSPDPWRVHARVTAMLREDPPALQENLHPPG